MTSAVSGLRLEDRYKHMTLRMKDKVSVSLQKYQNAPLRELLKLKKVMKYQKRQPTTPFSTDFDQLNQIKNFNFFFHPSSCCCNPHTFSSDHIKIKDPFKLQNTMEGRSKKRGANINNNK